MIELIQANWLAFVAVLLLGIAIAWWLWAKGKPAERVRHETPDVLTPGAKPAERNSLLVDSKPASEPVAPMAPPGLAGAGEAVAAVVMEPPQPETASAPAEADDDLTRIKGLGPKLSARLNELGVNTYAQIAAWTDDDIERIDAQLGNFQGRIRRDSWVEQCGYLASGDVTGFEGRFGKV